MAPTRLAAAAPASVAADIASLPLLAAFPRSVLTAGSSETVDLPSAIAGMMSAKYGVLASLAVARTANDMLAEAIDLGDYGAGRADGA